MEWFQLLIQVQFTNSVLRKGKGTQVQDGSINGNSPLIMGNWLFLKLQNL